MTVGLTSRPQVRAVDPVAERGLLMGLYARARAEEFASLPEDQRDGLLAFQYEAQDRAITSATPGATRAVIELDGAAVGLFVVHRTPTEIRIVDISLLPEARGAGIGTAVLTELICESRSTQRPVTLHVAHGNRARTLYERLGFRLVATDGAHDRLEYKETE